MNNLETLKQELLAQKSAIEEKGGVVSVANNNPSPSEITKGIKTIELVDFTTADATAKDVLAGKTFYAGNSQIKVGELEIKSTDFSVADATEQDVLAGKTFFAGNGDLKTGQFTLDDIYEKNRALFEYEDDVMLNETRYTYNINPEVNEIRYGMFRSNANHVDVYFHEGITDINNYAFYNTKNFRFFNFSNMVNLKTIYGYAFEGANCSSIDFTNFPPNLESIMQRAFYGALQDGMSVVLPSNLTTLQQYAFYSLNRVTLNNFVVPNDCKVKTLSTFALYNTACNCDFYAHSATTIGSKFNYNGSFNNIIIAEANTTLNDKCFSADSTKPISDFALSTVTFLASTPPSIPNEPFAPQAVENGLKIYVPDESVSAYKAKFAARYTNCIYPVSQKD